MDEDVRISSDWRRKMSVQRYIESVVMILGLIRQHASTEVLSILHTPVPSLPALGPWHPQADRGPSLESFIGFPLRLIFAKQNTQYTRLSKTLPVQ